MRTLATLLVLGAGATCTAQVILDDANTTPQVGDMFVRGLGSYLDPAPSGGMPIAYDYSSAVAFQTDTITNSSPLGTEWFNGLIPGSEAEVWDLWAFPDGNARYYAGTPAGLELVGFLDGGTFALSDTKLTITYPCQDGSSWSDTYFGYDALFDLGKVGSLSVVAGPVCDVITPAGTHSNVLRLLTTESIDRSASGSFFSHTDVTIATFHAPGIHHPVMWAMTSSGYDLMGTTSSGQMTMWLAGDFSTSIGREFEARDEWSIGPVPVGGHLWLFGDVGCESCGYRITDAPGSLLAEGGAQDLRTGLDVSELPPGLYLLQCNGAVKRFIKN